MFERATRMKLRFPAGKGNISVEDLWDMPLTSNTGYDLDTLANNLYKSIKDKSVSFVAPVSSGDSTLNLKLNIVKSVIAYKLEQREEAERKIAKKARKQELLKLIAEKDSEKDKGRSRDDLQRELESL